MLEQYISYDESQHQLIVQQSSRDGNSVDGSSVKINEFPNFPVRLKTSLQNVLRQDYEDNDDEELESDLMDSDEQNAGLGLRELNEKLRQLTHPAFFKKLLNRQQYQHGSGESLAGP